MKVPTLNPMVFFMVVWTLTSQAFADAPSERAFQQLYRWVEQTCSLAKADWVQCVPAQVDVTWDVKHSKKFWPSGWSSSGKPSKHDSSVKLADKYVGAVIYLTIDRCNAPRLGLPGMDMPCQPPEQPTAYQFSSFVVEELAGRLIAFSSDTGDRITQKDVGTWSNSLSLATNNVIYPMGLRVREPQLYIVSNELANARGMKRLFGRPKDPWAWGLPGHKTPDYLNFFFHQVGPNDPFKYQTILYASHISEMQVFILRKPPLFTTEEMVKAWSTGEITKTVPATKPWRTSPQQSGTARVTIRPKQKVCGPDISEQLVEVLKAIGDTFNSLSEKEQKRACNFVKEPTVQNIAAGWDICELYLKQTDWLYSDPEFAEQSCGTPFFGDPSTRTIETRRFSPCGNSVQVGEHCYLAGSVNYAMYGAIGRLCNDRFKNFGEIQNKLFISGWKWATGDDLTPPLAWAQWGFEASSNNWSLLSIPKGSAINRRDCAVRCRSPSPDKYCTKQCTAKPKKPFTFRWLPFQQKCLPARLDSERIR